MKKETNYTVQVQRQAHRSGLSRMRQAYLKLLTESQERALFKNQDSHLCKNEPPYTGECQLCGKKKMPQ